MIFLNFAGKYLMEKIEDCDTKYVN
jgi:hypothetical protein